MILFILENFQQYLILFFTVFFVIFLVIVYIQVRKRKSRNLTVHHISWYHRLYTSFLFNRAFRSIFRLLILFIFMQFIGIALPTVLAEEIAEQLEEKKEEEKKGEPKSWWKGIAIAAALTLGAWLLMKLLRAGGFYPGSGNSGSDTSFSSGSDTSSDSGSDAASDSGSEISGQSSGSEISSKSSGSEPAQNVRLTTAPETITIRPQTKYDYAALDIIKYNETTYNHMIEIRRDQECIMNILQNRGMSLDSVTDLQQVVVSLAAYTRTLAENNVPVYEDLPLNFYCAYNIWLKEFLHSRFQDPNSAMHTLLSMMDHIKGRGQEYVR